MSDQDQITFDVEGMTCASCALRVERVLQRQDGVDQAVVSFAGQEARVEAAPGTDVEQLEAAVAKIGYTIVPVAEGEARVSATERFDAEAATQRRNVIGAAALAGWAPAATSAETAVPAFTKVAGDLPPG